MKEFKRRTSEIHSPKSSAFQDELNDLNERRVLRSITCIDSSMNGVISIEGQNFLDFSSNDYLNLSTHPDISAAVIKAVRQYGYGAGASRLLSGTYSSHARLESAIAEFKKTESAIVFNTGYAANTGAIPVIAGEGAVIYSDELNHASIVDGCRLSKADIRIYRHSDCGHLESLIKKDSESGQYSRRLIVSDTVFSMDGDLAPLPDIVSLSKRYDALLLIDDAHGTGILGKNGRGACEHFSIDPAEVIQMGTLSKAAGCFGAFVAGEKGLTDLLLNRSRSFMYSTALPPAAAEAAIAALKILSESAGGLRSKLWKARARLFAGLKGLGLDNMGSETPIIPIRCGSAANALNMSAHLYSNEIFATAIRPPTVPEGSSRIRLSVTAAHTDEHIDMVIDALRSFSIE